jgi:hypothetical protein
MKFDSEKVSDIRTKLDKIWNHVDLSTTCCRQCGCCRVACPQMKYSEAVNILTKIWSEWTKEEKKELLITCIRYFFSRSLVKPCPLLKGNECRVYEEGRPLNCRLYGLWPQDVWERRVQALANKLDLPKEQIPLNQQCVFVKRKNGEPLTEEVIEGLFASLDELDKFVLSEGDSSKYEEWQGRIEKNWNHRAIHDWVLLHFWGEEALMQMTSIAMAADETQLENLMKAVEESVDLIVKE